MIMTIVNSNIGCCALGCFINILTYADDLHPSHKCYDCGLRAPYDVKMVKFSRCPYGRRGIVRSPWDF